MSDKKTTEITPYDDKPLDKPSSSSPTNPQPADTAGSSSTPPASTNTQAQPSIYTGSSSYLKRKLGLKPKQPFVVLGDDDDTLSRKDFSILAWEAFESAGKVAIECNTMVVKPEHLLKSLLEQTHGLAGVIVSKLGVDVKSLQQQTNEFIQKNPIDESNKAMQALMILARDYRTTFKAPLVSPDHIFLAFADDKRIGKSMFQLFLITKEKVTNCIREINKSIKKVDVKVGDLKESQEKLSLFGEYLTTKAKSGKLDPVIERECEIRSCIDILQAKNRNNPILIGEAGVGKTAVVEGIAQKIVQGDVPEALVNCTIISLDMAALMAGASTTGMFEERLKTVLREVKKSNGQIILFIDEIHLLIGTGAQRGPMDAANILKPLLARGELCCIGATTLSEYQRYFETDSALARRFRIVFVEQPSIEKSVLILRGLQETYELHHGVRIGEGVIEDAVTRSERYISAHCLPDKAIDLLDQSAAHLKTMMTTRPSIFDDYNRKISKLVHGEHSSSNDPNLDVAQKLLKLRKEQSVKLKQWEYEKTVISHIQLLKKQIREVKENVQKFEFECNFDSANDLKNGALKLLLHQLKISTEEFDNREPIIRDKVSSDDIGKTISKKTGIPVSSLLESEKEKLLKVSGKIRQRLVGQYHAVKAVERAMHASKSHISKPNRPTCSLMFLGPPGVGKTELAKVLASCMFNSEDALVRINMTEFKDSSSIAKLIGAAPGLIGYETRGLFELVRMRPYSVVLFDEIEKGHENVRNLLLQILSDGRVRDSHQSVISFANTIIVMTSNVGGKEVLTYKNTEYKILKEKVMVPMKEKFSIEFIDRIDEIIVFGPLSLDEITSITRIQLEDIKKRADGKKIKLQFDEAVAQYIGGLAHAAGSGGREVDRVIRQKIEAEYNIFVLNDEFGEGDTVHVSIKQSEQDKEISIQQSEQDKEIIVFNKKNVT